MQLKFAELYYLSSEIIINVVCCVGSVLIQIEIEKWVSLFRRANARNVRLYYPYRQYTNLFLFRFVLFKILHENEKIIFVSAVSLIGQLFLGIDKISRFGDVF